MKITTDNLVGTWYKGTDSSCASYYPDKVILGAGGIYQAPRGPETGSIWHGGDWELDANLMLVIQASNDAMLHYRIVAFADEKLTLEDEFDCRIIYKNKP